MSSHRSSTVRAVATLYRPALLAGALTLAVFGATAHARQVPQNVGYGLDKLIERSQNLQPNNATHDEGYATTAAEMYADRVITDANTGRILVDVLLNGRVPFEDVKASLLAKIPSLSISATDANYRRTGIIEGYVTVDDAAAIAQSAGVRSVFLALKPDVDSAIVNEPREAAASSQGPSPQVMPGETLNKIGTAFDQGVVQHRIDRINTLYNPAAPVNYDGTA